MVWVLCRPSAPQRDMQIMAFVLDCRHHLRTTPCTLSVEQMQYAEASAQHPLTGYGVTTHAGCASASARAGNPPWGGEGGGGAHVDQIALVSQLMPRLAAAALGHDKALAPGYRVHHALRPRP